MLYLWLKAFHIIGFVAWFAGLFYIFRLYVYHVENRDKPEITQLLAIMERRLYRGICWPAMIFTATFGVALFVQMPGFYMAQGWFHAKLALVLALSGVHGYFSAAVRAFAEDRNTRTARHWRLVNEVPTLLMIAIVVQVVVKPF